MSATICACLCAHSCRCFPLTAGACRSDASTAAATALLALRERSPRPRAAGHTRTPVTQYVLVGKSQWCAPPLGPSHLSRNNCQCDNCPCFAQSCPELGMAKCGVGIVLCKRPLRGCLAFCIGCLSRYLFAVRGLWRRCSFVTASPFATPEPNSERKAPRSNPMSAGPPTPMEPQAPPLPPPGQKRKEREDEVLPPGPAPPAGPPDLAA